MIHGGPGVACNYVRDAHLCYADQGYRVVLWHQLGCGESDRPDDESLWTVERYSAHTSSTAPARSAGTTAWATCTA